MILQPLGGLHAGRTRVAAMVNLTRIYTARVTAARPASAT
jgi:hypothetical protein